MMPGLRVYRSGLRNILTFVAGALLLIGAWDVTVGHALSSAPETDEESGALTSRGQSQRRTDWMFGTVFVVFGGGAVLLSVSAAALRRPLVELTSEAMRLRIAGPQRYVELPWEEITWVHSGADGDDDRIPPRVLLVHVASAEPYPTSLWGASWDGSTLMVDADSWSLPPEDVAAYALVALETWGRHHRAEPALEDPG
jgi:hypothetical protein